jgi:hypothetical protein
MASRQVRLFIWRRQLLAEAIAHGVGSHGFVPVEIAHEHSAAALMHVASAERRIGATL